MSVIYEYENISVYRLCPEVEIIICVYIVMTSECMNCCV
jgi:hypothetical protein